MGSLLSAPVALGSGPSRLDWKFALGLGLTSLCFLAGGQQKALRNGRAVAESPEKARHSLGAWLRPVIGDSTPTQQGPSLCEEMAFRMTRLSQIHHSPVYLSMGIAAVGCMSHQSSAGGRGRDKRVLY